MPRNIERDEKEAMRRKEQLMDSGCFRNMGSRMSVYRGWRTLRKWALRPYITIIRRRSSL